MPQQPESTTSPLAPNPASAPGPARPAVSASPDDSHHHAPQRIPPWLESSELVLRVLLRMYIGLAICYAPWSGQILTFLPWSHLLWDQNPLFIRFPELGIYAASGAVRGLVSGLGLLNIWIAFQDALHHRD